MKSPNETPSAANDIQSKIRGDLEAIFAKVAKQAKNQSIDAPESLIATTAQQGGVDPLNSKTAPSS